MTRCRVEKCPYRIQDFCSRRITSINEYGLCSFLFRGQTPREIHNDDEWHYVKNPIAVAEFSLEDLQDESENLMNGTAAFQENNQQEKEEIIKNEQKTETRFS